MQISMIRMRIVLALLLLVAVANLAMVRANAPATVTTVLIVRHAEKAAEPADNPPLTAAGQARAQELMRTLGSAGVNVIYATQFLRTQQTVEPLAKQLGLEIKRSDAADIKGLTERVVREHAGSVVLIAAHSNTVPKIVEALGAGPVAAIEDKTHDNLYVVTVIAPRQAKVVTLKYGEKS